MLLARTDDDTSYLKVSAHMFFNAITAASEAIEKSELGLYGVSEEDAFGDVGFGPIEAGD